MMVQKMMFSDLRMMGLIPGMGIPGMAAATMSRVVRFPSMVKQSDLDDGDSWGDFLDDVKQGCAAHGIITSAVIITPEKKVSRHYLSSQNISILPKVLQQPINQNMYYDLLCKYVLRFIRETHPMKLVMCFSNLLLLQRLLFVLRVSVDYSNHSTCIKFSSSGMTGRRYLERSVTSMPIEEAVYSQLIKPLAS